ncbi:AEC family transporter [Thauera sp. 2A1]|uniref:AEC family transporter n=1 Tax=Thauera sp. 2A1 TaxID=2570191 RepID=UPI001291176D|nr:AEC family transporter [Thauera sp. 2A1]KAI5914151.1 AEC family transporter [Thauera sp. 2A1]
MLIRIVSILFPLFAITALGYFVGRRVKPDLSHANKLNMDVFVPALVFGALVSKDFRIGEYLPLLLATLVIIVGSGVVGLLVARSAGIASKTLVPPMMFNNCGNLGLPLAVLAFGDSALAPAVVMFVVSNVIHFSYGAWLLDHHTRLTNVWRSPSILATITGLAVGLAGIEVWPPLLMSIRMVGDVSIPLMLFALGVRLADSRINAVGFGVFGAVLRPVVGMVLAWALLQLIDLPPREQALLLVFGALPPAVLNYMFAERYDQEPDKVASMVLIGNVAAVVFLPIALAMALK